MWLQPTKQGLKNLRKENKMANKTEKRTEKRGKLSEKERIIDLLERIGAATLYINTPLGQTEVARILGMDNNRTNELLKGVRKLSKSEMP